MPYMKDMKLRRNNLETSMQAKLNRLAEEVSVYNRANDHKSKLEKIMKTRTLPDNIQKVLEFDKECEHNGQKLSTRYSTLITIHNLCQFAGKKPFKQFTRTDIVNFLDMAKHRKFEDTRKMKNSTRKTRSDKFPLTLHPAGQYCKKIRGKIHYFGKDKKKALENTWLRQPICTEPRVWPRKSPTAK